MKSIKLLVSGAFVLALLAPVFIVGTVSAQRVSLECDYNPQIDPSGICDLAINKEVSVNGAAFVDADTEPNAVGATVGDTVVWRITVTDGLTGGDYGNPQGTVYVNDVLPSGFSMDASDPSDGTFGSNTWTLPLMTYVGEGSFSNLPAVLTLTTTATGLGVFENIAAFNIWDPCVDGCIDPTPYADNVGGNNANSAWVSVSATPVVLADSTEVLANTGSGLVASFLAAGLIFSTIGVLAYSHISRKY